MSGNWAKDSRGVWRLGYYRVSRIGPEWYHLEGQNFENEYTTLAAAKRGAEARAKKEAKANEREGTKGGTTH